MAGVTLSIVVPVYNERQFLQEILTRICSAPLVKAGADASWDRVSAMEIIAVDDASRDGSREWLQRLEKTFAQELGKNCTVPTTFRLLLQPENQGKGAAIRRGIDSTVGDIVLVQDADLEYSPSDYPQLLAPILANKADAVFGSRFIGSEEKRVLYFWHMMINQFLTTLTNMLCDTTLTDMETCYKVMRGDLARSLNLVSNRFGVEPELAARIAKARVRIFEVGISYNGRTYEEGKKIGPLDGAAALWHIVRFSVFGGNPFRPGLRQAAYGIQEINDRFYCDPLRRELAGLPKRSYLRVLEIGSGLGTVTRLLSAKGRTLVAADIDPKVVKHLNDRFRFHPSFKAVTWDATTSPRGSSTPREIAQGGFDLVVAVNLLEHVENDAQVLSRWSSLLSDDGVMIVLVPYSRLLFSAVDRAVGHLRRYDRRDLDKLVDDAGLEIVDARFANGLALFGWLFNSKLLGRTELPGTQVRAYSALKPLLKPVERLVERFAGQSLIAVVRRKATTAATGRASQSSTGKVVSLAKARARRTRARTRKAA